MVPSRKRKHVFFLLLNWICLFCVLPVWATASEGEHTFSIYIENDFFVSRDDQYTNGLKLTWSRFGLSELPDDALMHKWFYPVLRRIGFDRPDGAEKILSFSIGQNIYTPDDIESKDLAEDDRPYGGITYAELGFHRKLNRQMHTIGLCAGIVGPDSGAEKMQSAVHDLINSTDPQGWDHQLKNEPVFCLIYDYKRKFYTSDGIESGLGSDMVFNTGASLGTALTFYNLGLLFRWGWNIPGDCGNFPIAPASCFNAEARENFCRHPAKRYGAHIFLSANGRAVLRDVFLDGNTFRDSHSVNKRPVVGTFVGGLGLITGRVKTVISCVYQTKAFYRQKHNEMFGSVCCSLYY
jgi:hypothetical protein